MLSIETVRGAITCIRDLRQEAKSGYPYSELPEEVGVLVGNDHAGLAGAVFARQAYDLAHAHEESDPDARAEVARVGALALTLFEKIDDLIDDTSLPYSYRLDYLDRWSDAHMEGLDFTTVRPTNEDDFMHARLAFHLYNRFDSPRDVKRYSQLVAYAMRTVRRQVVSNDSAEQFAAIADVGAVCARTASVACEIVDGREYPVVDRAMSSIGAYGLYVDHASEIYGDIYEAAPCYATIRMQELGVGASAIHSIRRQLLARGKEHLQRGRAELNDDQRVLYDTSRMMIDLRYRVLGRTVDVLRVVSCRSHVKELHKLTVSS